MEGGGWRRGGGERKLRRSRRFARGEKRSCLTWDFFFAFCLIACSEATQQYSLENGGIIKKIVLKKSYELEFIWILSSVQVVVTSTLNASVGSNYLLVNHCPMVAQWYDEYSSPLDSGIYMVGIEYSSLIVWVFGNKIVLFRSSTVGLYAHYLVYTIYYNVEYIYNVV